MMKMNSSSSSSLVAVVVFFLVQMLIQTSLGKELNQDDTTMSSVPSSQRLLRGLTDTTSDVQVRIIGGTVVNPKSNRYPYFSLMWGGSLCGGALIAPDVVVTAAHCYGASETVWVGKQSREPDVQDNSELILIQEKIRHPDYVENGFDMDIMLLKLESSSKKDLIRLNNDPTVPVKDQQLHIMGFGDIDPSTLVDLPLDMYETDVNYVPQNTCSKIHQGNMITDDMLCAWANGQDSCAGDSGGPLIVKGDTDADDVLVGVVTWGRGCASEYPGVYSRISYFHDWLVETTCAISKKAPTYFNCFGQVTLAPTDSPTNAPTSIFWGFDWGALMSPSPTGPTVSPAPTPAPSVTHAPTVMDKLKFVAWDGSTPLGHCEGDCEVDSDCGENLKCFQRGSLDTNREVPGCDSSNPKGIPTIADFCVWADDYPY